MRKLTTKATLGHRSVALLIGPLLTAGLLAAIPSVASADTPGLGPDNTKSVPVTKAEKAAAAKSQAATKSVVLDEPEWPAEGEITEITIGEEFTEGSADLAARSEDPEGSPSAITVEAMGKLEPSEVNSIGAAYTIGLPEDAQREPEPTPSPEPTDEGPTPQAPTAEPTIEPSAEGISYRPLTVVEPDPEQAPEPEGDGEEDAEADLDDYTAPVEVQISYDAYAGAYGGDWASRLNAIQLDDCTTVEGELSCESATPMVSTNDSENNTVKVMIPAAQYSAGSTVVALVAGAGSDKGDYASSPLSESSSWSSAGNSGDFNWSYPIAGPPVASGLTPDLSLDYSSGSVDGRTASTSPQVSDFGEGFSLDPGFVERSYEPCKDDYSVPSNAPSDSNDLCWSNDNLTISLGGKTQQLIRGEGTEWRMRFDDGTKIDHLHLPSGQLNADDNEEYWLATTTDGTRYYFGRNYRFQGDDNRTDSVSAVPVFGDNANDPCHETSFSDSSCQQAWRWSLDYVIDPNGNTMSYYYTQEENHYGINNNQDAVKYDRAVRLNKIVYGTHFGQDNGQIPAAATITINRETRCIPTPEFACDSQDESHAGRWPDVPLDRNCFPPETKCPGRTAPTFYTIYRASKITASSLSPGSPGYGSYEAVNTWDLVQSFPETGDNSSSSLWLNSIQQTGSKGTAKEVALPAITFTGVEKENRVDERSDGLEPFIKWRVAAIRNGMGGVTAVNYSAKDCYPSDRPSGTTLDTNNRMCFPVYFQPDFADDAQLEFFHKYVVQSVVETDLTGGSPSVTTDYAYGGSPAWHFSESNLGRWKYKTWSDWRGFQNVTTKVGGAGATTWNDTLYMRGMNGDRTDDPNITKSVTISDGTDSPSITDSPQYRGFARRTKAMQGSGGAVVSVDVNTPTYTTTSYDDTFHAWIINTAGTQTKTKLATGSDRVTETTTAFDAYARPITFNDLGDTSTSADNQCTTTSYANNVADWIMDAVSETVTSTEDCTPASADDIISASSSYFDGSTSLGAAPTAGNVTTARSAKGWDGGVLYRADATTVYDSLGRPTESTDALSNKTKTTYIHPDGHPNVMPTEVKVENALHQFTTMKPNRKWGSADQVTEVGGLQTDVEYDGVGRTTAVWMPGRNKANQTASTMYDYSLNNTSPNRVTTQTLNSTGSHTTTQAFFDGLLRPRETQAPSASSDGGRVITEKIYDSRGWLESERGPYFNKDAVGTALVKASANQVPSYTDYEYDRTGRQTAQVLMSLGKEKWRTTTAYGGDRVSVTPPTGGTATTTISDARGQTTSLLQYTGPTPTGTSDETTYAYTPAGKLKTVKDATNTPTVAGSVWEYEYDIRGNQTKMKDPDKGLSTTAYDVLDRPVKTGDAENQWLWTTYDALGRKTELRDGTENDPGALRASWKFDDLQIGQLTSSTRYEDGAEYKISATGYDGGGRPLGSKVMLPSSEGDLYRANGYVTKLDYYPNGLVKRATQPFVTGTDVTNEAINYTYDTLGNPKTMTGTGALVAGTEYTPFGQVSRRALGPTIGKAVQDDRDYDAASGRLLRQTAVVQSDASTTRMDLRYGYDNAGNVTRLDDIAPGDTTSTNAASRKQCFTYDYLRRMTAAWTSAASATTCAATPQADLGTQAPYADVFTYDKMGNRKTWSQKRGAGGATSTDHTLAYPTPSATAGTRPHGVTQVASTGSAPQTETLTYDAVGNTVTRAGGSIDQAIAWDVEGHQESVENTATDEKTSYLYDADGNRLIKRDESADSATLFVGGSEYTDSNTNSPSTELKLERSYSIDGEPIATRKANGVLTLVVADRQNTGQLAISADGATIVKRRFDPFGTELSVSGGAWPNQHGYLDKTTDTSTGTTHLGAREYDPVLGRFLSVDPVLDPMDPQQMNGYAYANNSPVTMLDPDGLRTMCGEQGCNLKAPKGLGGPVVKQKKKQSFFGAITNKAKNVVKHQIRNTAGSLMAAAEIADLVSNHPSYPLSTTPSEYLGMGFDAVGIDRDNASYKTGYWSTVVASLFVGGGAGAGGKLGAILRNVFKSKSAAAKSVRYGPHNPGPLADDVANTFRSGSYTQTTLSDSATLYRAYGGKAGELGSYWTRTKPRGPLQSQLDSALNPAWGNTASSVATIRVPAGTSIYEGAAASQPIAGGGSLLGGGSQVYISRVDASWLVP